MSGFAVRGATLAPCLTRSRWLGVAAAVGLCLTACGGDGGEDPASPTATAVVEQTATAAVTATAPPPQETSLALPAELQSVVDTIVEGDAGAIRAITLTVPTYCGGPAECPDRGEAGIYPIIRATGCEPLLPNDKEGNIDGALERYGGDVRTLLAVYEDTETGPVSEWVPRGSHVVVVWWSAKETAPTASAFHVRDGAITGIRFGCGTPPEWYYQGVDGSRFLYGPAPVP